MRDVVEVFGDLLMGALWGVAGGLALAVAVVEVIS